MRGLEGIAAQLRCGENVQNPQLQRWLTKEEYDQIEVEWQYQKEIRDELKDKTHELKSYEKKHVQQYNKNIQFNRLSVKK